MLRRLRIRLSSTMERVLSLSRALLSSTPASSTEDVATAPTTVALETSLSRTSKPGVFPTLLVSTLTTATLPISLVPAEVASRRSARSSRASRRVRVRVKRSAPLPTARARALYLPVKCLIVSGHKRNYAKSIRDEMIWSLYVSLDQHLGYFILASESLRTFLHKGFDRKEIFASTF